MYKQLVCLVLGTLAVGSQAFMPAAPLVKASASSAARVIQPAVPETGASVCHCVGGGCGLARPLQGWSSEWIGGEAFWGCVIGVGPTYPWPKLASIDRLTD